MGNHVTQSPGQTSGIAWGCRHGWPGNRQTHNKERSAFRLVIAGDVSLMVLHNAIDRGRSSLPPEFSGSGGDLRLGLPSVRGSRYPREIFLPHSAARNSTDRKGGCGYAALVGQSCASWKAVLG